MKRLRQLSVTPSRSAVFRWRSPRGSRLTQFGTGVLWLLLILLLAGCGAKPVAPSAGMSEVTATATAVAPPTPDDTVVNDTTMEDDAVMDGRDPGMAGSLAGETVTDLLATAGAIFGAGDFDPTGHVEVGSGEAAAAGQAVALLAALPDVAGWLANFPDWQATAWQDEDDGRFYSLDLYSPAADEWLGWAWVNVAEATVDDYFVPRELTAEEFQAGRDRVEAFIFNDEAVLARLEETAAWEHDIYYNRWDALWEVYFWRGLEELMVVVGSWEDELYVEKMVNPLELAAEEAAENDRNTAVSLAWQAEGIDQALADSDNWRTYVSQQADAIYAVSFVTDERELFYALVDVAQGQVLESAMGSP